jgi:hypothetical protein
MTNHDNFDDDKPNNFFNSFLSSVGPKAAFFIVLIALSFMIGVVWKLYVGGDNSTLPSENVPIIRADKEPYKVQPDDPGGMQMPNKNSTIFSSLNSNDEDRGVENLLADNEEEDPVPRSQLFAGLNTERDESLHAEVQDMPLDRPLNEDQERILSQAREAKAIVSNLLADGVDAIEASDDELSDDSMSDGEGAQKPTEAAKQPEPKIETEKKSEQPEKKVEIKKIEPKLALKPELKPAPKAEPKPEPKKVEVKKAEPPAQLKFNNPVTLGGDYYIQLASVQDRSRTESEWNLLKKKYGSILSGYKYRVETAQLAKGTYYRIQAGPVSKAQAKKTCDAIKRKSPSGCIVKKK